MTNSEIIAIFEKIFKEDDYSNTSRLHFPEFKTSKTEVQLVTLYGGMNGWGESRDYLYDLYELINALEANGINAYITEFWIDALDDLFKVTIELRDGTDKIEESK